MRKQLVIMFYMWFGLTFLAGFVYLVAGTGIWMRKRWAVWLSLLIFTATIIVFAGLWITHT